MSTEQAAKKFVELLESPILELIDKITDMLEEFGLNEPKQEEDPDNGLVRMSE